VAAQNEPVRPRPLRAVPDDGYTDWKAVYQDNAGWVYRTLFARVGNLGREITSIDDIEQPPESEEAISTAPLRVAKVLESLPDHYRRILELRFLQGNSIKESASELGISIANAKVLQHRALRLAAQVNDGGQP
jgi:RNA polymerase sigma factor (sigma-70 family)